MRGWSSVVVGSGLLALAAWAQLTGFSSAAAISFGLAGAFLLYRGLQGMEITDAGDPTALGDFISNPAEALVEAAAGQAEEWLTDKRKTRVDEPSADGTCGFDADAALARYMANRPNNPPAVETSPPVRGFGRKGL